MNDYAEQLNQIRAKEKKIKKTVKAKILPESQISGAEFAVIGSIALISDALDYFGIGLLSLRMLDICTTIILGLWCFIRLKKFPSARFAATFIIEMIPFLGDFSPTWTIFIIAIYAEQRGYMPKISKFIK